MKIYRDGKEYELTQDELLYAYFERQFDFDIQDVKNELQSIIDDDIDDVGYVQAAKRVLKNHDLLSDCAHALRKNIDKYDMDWSYAKSDAVRNAVCEEQARGDDDFDGQRQD